MPTKDPTIPPDADFEYTADVARALLQDFSLKELRAACRRLNVRCSRMARDEMIEALIAADEGVEA